MDLKKKKLAIIGLGYVGLPLAVEFSKKYKVVGFDLDSSRIKELINHFDRTKELSRKDLKGCKNLEFHSREACLKDIDIFIVTVPTPIDIKNEPNLKPLKDASKLVGRFIKKEGIVVYESTVYPGCTEEVCIPIIEKESQLKLNKDFYCGYSPERINPGDKTKKLTDIVKITSGSSPKASSHIDKLYKSIISAGTHRASSIKVAESAKVIENTQRDLNIALMNELSLIFNKLGINTREVLEAANTKWNFLDFRPGLVGGHCIGVDPYYLTHKAQSIGYEPKVILSGRDINDSMGKHIAEMFTKLLKNKNIPIESSRVLVMGITFKENCPDIRNTKVVDLIKSLQNYGATVTVHDPNVSSEQSYKNYGIKICENLKFKKKFHGIIFAVEHKEFKKIKNSDLSKILLKNSVIYDLKNTLPSDLINSNL